MTRMRCRVALEQQRGPTGAAPCWKQRSGDIAATEWAHWITECCWHWIACDCLQWIAVGFLHWIACIGLLALDCSFWVTATELPVSSSNWITRTWWSACLAYLARCLQMFPSTNRLLGTTRSLFAKPFGKYLAITRSNTARRLFPLFRERERKRAGDDDKISGERRKLKRQSEVTKSWWSAGNILQNSQRESGNIDEFGIFFFAIS